MENANKIISFVLGLIVVIVVLLLITGRLGLFKGKNILPISRGNTSSPTPSPKKTAQGNNQSPTPTSRRLAVNTIATATPTPVMQNNNTSNQQKDSDTIKTIPSTGASTELFVVLLALLIGGTYLSKVKISS